eukprot:CAMPEP_0179010646 /NCGR_PEP_ID=MMETSP0796-20121207/231_1 /TAXON_ID=73915 /ORGANISM="Pyrodinium bahamense, Strain pbaha01" /LENGTH=67 /DNA_ID=CAMNT_0020705951 /DNA_START=88 /DNA_END=291 /DNA_ORIENTATION=-
MSSEEAEEAARNLQMLSAKECIGRQYYGPGVVVLSTLAYYLGILGPVWHTVFLWHGVAVYRSGKSSH